MRRPSYSKSALVIATLVAAGCKPKTPETRPDASIASTADSAAPKEAMVDPIVDLLHAVESTVAVSSKVDNPHDYPEHLVDGRPETAWNSKTGDLKGWIAFRVPKQARVLRIELTPGYDKITSAPSIRDLFTMNHRIKKVRVTREGTLLKEVTLDVEKRELQAIDVDAEGGDFKIEILETVPGTQKNWRELTVSEFRVWGRAGGSPASRTHIPKMAIGSLDGVPAAPPATKTDPPRGPFASVAELCGAYEKLMKPLLDAKYTDATYPGKLSGAPCRQVQQPPGFAKTAVEHGPFKDAVFVHLDDLEEETITLLVKTEKGWSRTSVVTSSRAHEDPGCLHVVNDLFESVAWATTSTGQEVALVSVVHREVQWFTMQGASDGADTEEVVYACRVEASGAVGCEGPKVSGKAHEPLPSTWPNDATFQEVHLGKIPWSTRKKPTVGPAGDLRFE